MCFRTKTKKSELFSACFLKNSEVLERSRAPVFGVFLNIERQVELVTLRQCIKSVQNVMPTKKFQNQT